MKDKKPIEFYLGKFSIKSPPERLRSKILDAALRKKKESRVMTPGLWRILGISTALILISFILDPDLIRWSSHSTQSSEILMEYQEILEDPSGGYIISKLQMQLLKKQSETVFDRTKYTKEIFNEY